ncbi:SUMF1/EgtB/PvdO family nonheme iron enzyme [bacterium]|nr:SUMF1/EgtB/PvdO family nonheme iron enzyme [bacterium]
MGSLIEQLDKAETLGGHSWRLADGTVVRELLGLSAEAAQRRLEELQRFREAAGSALAMPDRLVSEDGRLFALRSWAEGSPLQPVIDESMAERILVLMSSLPPELVVYDLRPEHLIDGPQGLCLIDPGFNPAGVPPYAAPEQYGRGDIAPAIVNYQLGATLLHLFSGQPPQDAMTLLIPSIEPPLIEQLPSSLAQRFGQLLEAQGSSRPSPQDLLGELQTWLAFRSSAGDEDEAEGVKAEHERTVWDEKAEDSELADDSVSDFLRSRAEHCKDQVQSALSQFWDRHSLALTMFGIPLLVSATLGVFLWAEGDAVAELAGIEPFWRQKQKAVADSRFPADKDLPKSWVCDADGARMILIPAGPFYEGPAPEAGVGAEPMITTLPAFYIDRFEVTNKQFKHFVDCTGYKAEGTWIKYATPERMNHPVICVSWHDAQAYAKWAGKRLPTAEEWEKAARGGDARRFPWGNTWDASRLNSFESNRGNTAPVGSYPSGASPYGVEDMAGNVWEWVDAWYIPADSDGALPMLRQIRGGSRSDKAEDCLIVARRGVFPENGRLVNSGFRCVVDPQHPGVMGNGEFVELRSLPPGTGYERSHLPLPKQTPVPSAAPRPAFSADAEDPNLPAAAADNGYDDYYGGDSYGGNSGSYYSDPYAGAADYEGRYDPAFGGDGSDVPGGGNAPAPAYGGGMQNNSAPADGFGSEPLEPQTTMKMSSQYTDSDDAELTGDF